MALRRFINDHGAPALLLSDNFSTHQRIAGELRTFLTSEHVKQFALRNRIRWIFSTERNPRGNGCCEAMVKAVKLALKRSLRNVLLTYEEFDCVRKEIQFILNSRPLQHVGDGDLDCETLSPHDLIYGYSLQNLPSTHNIKTDFMPDSVFLKKRMKYLERVQNTFWRRFRDQYLTGLSMYHFNVRGQSRGPSIEPEVGEVVLVMEDDAPRALWRVARITETIAGADGHVRKCKIIFKGVDKDDKRSGPTFRPVHKLVPLELSKCRDACTDKN